MAKYTVRNGFVLHLETTDNRGRKSRQSFNSGTELELDEVQFAKYQHQVEPTTSKKTTTKLTS